MALLKDFGWQPNELQNATRGVAKGTILFLQKKNKNPKNEPMIFLMKRKK